MPAASKAPKTNDVASLSSAAAIGRAASAANVDPNASGAAFNAASLI